MHIRIYTHTYKHSWHGEMYVDIHTYILLKRINACMHS